MSIRKYTQKPPQVEAIQWDGKNQQEIASLFLVSGVPCYVDYSTEDDSLRITMAGREYSGRRGDYWTRGVMGQFAVWKKAEFEAQFTQQASDEDMAELMRLTEVIEKINTSRGW